MINYVLLVLFLVPSMLRFIEMAHRYILAIVYDYEH
jgi:hypothetical protein